jgi:2-iminoacetate synthase ThiH
MKSFEHPAAAKVDRPARPERPLEPEFFRGFNEKEKKALMSGLSNIELTKGCLVACKFCGFSAEPKISGHIIVPPKIRTVW